MWGGSLKGKKLGTDGEDIINIDLRETGCKGVLWVSLSLAGFGESGSAPSAEAPLFIASACVCRSAQNVHGYSKGSGFHINFYFSLWAK
jgi:hypothetical protein